MRDEEVIQLAPMTDVRLAWHQANVNALYSYVAVLRELGLDATKAVAQARKYYLEVKEWEKELNG